MHKIDETKVHCGSDVPFHKDLYKTLTLLKAYTEYSTPIYLVISGVCSHTGEKEEIDDSYFYDESTCPTNYIPIEAVMTQDDDDPHGCFTYVRTVWMPLDYKRGDTATIKRLFPEIEKGA